MSQWDGSPEEPEERLTLTLELSRAQALCLMDICQSPVLVGNPGYEGVQQRATREAVYTAIHAYLYHKLPCPQ